MSFSCSMSGSNIKDKMGATWKMIRRVLQSNKVEREQLKPGDHIYTWRRNFTYTTNHGIYVGDEKVVHLSRGSFSSSPSHSSDGNGRVVSCTIEDFLSGHQEIYLYEYGVNPIYFLIKPLRITCTLAHSDPPEHVLHRASFLLDNGLGDHNLFNNNSEAFALYCKTGLLLDHYMSEESSRSGPLICLMTAFVPLFLIPHQFLPASFTGLALLFCVIYCFARTSLDVGTNSSVKKVAVEKFDRLSYPRLERDTVDITDSKRRKSHATRSVFGIILLLRIWYWIPESTILLWLRYYCWAFVLFNLVSESLTYYGLKLSKSTTTILSLACFAIQFAKLNRLIFWITKTILLYMVRSYD